MPSNATQLAVHDVVKSYHGRTVLHGVTMAFPVGDRTGIVGENGSGKSTLLRLLAGLEQPDNGTVIQHTVGGIGYLPQDAALPPQLTVRDVLDHALRELRDMARELRAMENELATGDETALAAYGELLTQFELRGGYDADARVARALHGLGLRRLSEDRRVGSLSGGEQVRLQLAALLTQAPEVLLLDEPTNHLDDQALHWLEEHLRAHPGTTIAVSHDRVFLERTTQILVETDSDRGQLIRYGNGYRGYLAEKAAERRRWQQRHDEWLAETARLREKTGPVVARRVAQGRPIADANKMAYGRAGDRVAQAVSSRVRNAEERLHRLLADPVPPPPEPLRFTPGTAFTGTAHSGRPEREPAGGSPTAAAGFAVRAAGVAVAGRLAPVSFEVPADRGRLLVTGPNGAGKTTLLRLLAREIEPRSGSLDSHGRVGYLPQRAAPGRDNQTLLRAFAAGRPGTSEDQVTRLLSLGLFHTEQFLLPTARLSTGQRQRLALARLVTAPAEVLLLDEPTNHLSLSLVEELETALTEFPGAVVVVSHDRRLRERWDGDQLALTGHLNHPTS